jgi:hypothetical protein
MGWYAYQEEENLDISPEERLPNSEEVCQLGSLFGSIERISAIS